MTFFIDSELLQGGGEKESEEKINDGNIPFKGKGGFLEC